MDAKLSVKFGANKDVTNDTKKYAIQDAKLGANKGVTKDAKNWAQKWMLKRMEKKDAVDGVLRNCTIAPSLALDCSPQLKKNYTKIRCQIQH